jgi:hypothetical protein
MSLERPVKVGKLREALHAKAKGSPSYRFYLLYDKMYRADVLAWAYARCRENRGVSGIDDQTFADIKEYGLERWLDELAEMTSRRWAYLPEDEIVRSINQRLAGWANYFQLGLVSAAYRAVDRHTTSRLRRWLRRKYPVGKRGGARFSYTYLYQTLGLICLPQHPRTVPWANA